MQNYGVQVYPAGMVFHSNMRPRIVEVNGEVRLASWGARRGGERGAIRALSATSRKRLEFIAANAATGFRTVVTLTYHGLRRPGESVGERNARLAAETKRDLNRFLTCVRKDVGRYVWVQEFQARGVVHYHVLCEGTPTRERLSLAWLRATGELEDRAAERHAVRVDTVEDQRDVRWYVGRYLGKARQKSLPDGVELGGRWWGRSRGVELQVLREVVTQETGEIEARRLEARAVRSLRRWLSGKLRFRVRSGTFVDWRDRFATSAVEVLDQLQAFYGQKAREVAR